MTRIISMTQFYTSNKRAILSYMKALLNREKEGISV
ncbi:Uncharacterised protein [Staphylococcus delphini]|nr:Uncharacterised protein [Staphylococcus delphini]